MRSKPMPARKSHYQHVHYVAANVTFGDNGSAVTIGTIPAGARVLRAYAVVTEAFNAGDSNVLDIGTSGDADGFATDIALGTIGVIAADEMATTNDAAPSVDTVLTATPALAGTAASAGAADVIVEYIPEVA